MGSRIMLLFFVRRKEAFYQKLSIPEEALRISSFLRSRLLGSSELMARRLR